MAEHGAHVVLTDPKDEGRRLAEELAAARPGGAEFARLDVTVEKGWATLADDLRRRHGRLDMLVNNTGVAFRFGLMETTREDFQRVLDAWHCRPGRSTD